MELKVYYRIHKFPPLVCILSPSSRVYISDYIFKSHLILSFIHQ